MAARRSFSPDLLARLREMPAGDAPDGVGRVRPLDQVLVQESHRRLDEFPVAGEKERKALQPRLAQRGSGCLSCGRDEMVADLGRVRRRPPTTGSRLWSRTGSGGQTRMPRTSSPTATA